MLASAAGSDDEPAELLVWEVGTGRLLQALSGHATAVNSVAFHPDGTSLASVGRDGSVNGVGPGEGGKPRLQADVGLDQALTHGGVQRRRLGRVVVGGGVETIREHRRVGERRLGSCTATRALRRCRPALAITSGRGSLVAHSGKTGVVRLHGGRVGAEKSGLAMGMKGVACIAFQSGRQDVGGWQAPGSGVKLWDVATEREHLPLCLVIEEEPVSSLSAAMASCWCRRARLRSGGCGIRRGNEPRRAFPSSRRTW